VSLTAILRPSLPTNPLQLIERILPVLLVWAMSLTAAWLLGSLIWALIYPDPAPLPAPVTATAPRAASGDRADAAALAGMHLFGQPPAIIPSNQPEAAPDDLPETNLRLVLTGVMAAEPQTSSRAFIRVGATDAKVFAVGEEITSGATLEGVYLDRVVLRRAGRLETLRFPASENPGPAVQRRPASPARATAISAIQQGLDGDPQQLLRIIRPTPYFEDGDQVGYRVVPGQDRTAFSALGLQMGDVITHIDGQPLTDPGTSMVALQRLAESGRAQITVRREGRDVTLSLPIE